MEIFPPAFKFFEKASRSSESLFDTKNNIFEMNNKNLLKIHLRIKVNGEMDIVDPNFETIENQQKIFTFVLNKKFAESSVFFNDYCQKLKSLYIRSTNFYDVDIDISEFYGHIVVKIKDKFGLHSIVYKNESNSFSEIMMYEYFKFIKDNDINHLHFEFSPMYGLRIKTNDISVPEFFDSIFGDVYGEFHSIDSFHSFSSLYLTFADNYNVHNNTGVMNKRDCSNIFKYVNTNLTQDIKEHQINLRIK